jgi:hypothetical protein
MSPKTALTQSTHVQGCRPHLRLGRREARPVITILTRNLFQRTLQHVALLPGQRQRTHRCELGQLELRLRRRLQLAAVPTSSLANSRMVSLAILAWSGWQSTGSTRRSRRWLAAWSRCERAAPRHSGFLHRQVVLVRLVVVNNWCVVKVPRHYRLGRSSCPRSVPRAVGRACSGRTGSTTPYACCTCCSRPRALHPSPWL